VLERVLRAAPVGRRIVVGPSGADGGDLAARHGARFVLEDPPRSGPLAALARGVAEISEGPDEATVLVLGGDMPLLRPETLTALAARSAELARVVAARVEGRARCSSSARPGRWAGCVPRSPPSSARTAAGQT
jgi:CTP:molybdopterin cytidylyltransferase MocA